MFNETNMTVKSLKPLTAEQKARYLELMLHGNAHVDALYQIDATPAQWKLTKADVDFVKEVSRVKRHKPKQIESAVHMSATGHTSITKTTYQLSLDDEGLPVPDTDGKHTWLAIKKEVTELPPNASVLAALLKKQQDEDNSDAMLTPDELVAALEKAVKV